MSTETEVKIQIHEFEGFCSRIEALHPSTVAGRHFEDNHVLDFAGKSLQLSKSLVRIRFAGNGARITFKGPPAANGIFKTREELETGVEDGATALAILERLGMRVWFRYQKYRREFGLDSVVVSIDETPIGNYAELEGTEKGIRELARTLELDPQHFMRQSYYDLYLEHCRLRNEEPGDMVFR